MTLTPKDGETMKNIKALSFGKDARINGLIAFLIVASIALGCTCDMNTFGLNDNSSRPAANDRTYSEDNDRDIRDSRDTDIADDAEDASNTGTPSKAMIDDLVQSVTSQFASGVAAGDLSDFYDNAMSDEFKAEYSKAKFRSTFISFIEKKEAAAALLRNALSTEPQYSETPGPRTENGLDVIAAKGSYPTTPELTFEYSFIRNGSEWKLTKIALHT